MKKEAYNPSRLAVCWLLMQDDARNAQGSTRRVSDRLYEAQAYYESLGTDISRYEQAFVYGGREAEFRSFNVYPEGFRAELGPGENGRCPLEDLLLLAVSGMRELICYGEDSEEKSGGDEMQYIYRLVIITDYTPLSAGEAGKVLLSQLRDLKYRKAGVDFKVCLLNVDESGSGGVLSDVVDAWDTV